LGASPSEIAASANLGGSSSMILAVKIVWVIGFWNYDVFITINLLSIMKERKGFTGGWHEKINIGF
jgi:hypothetical protein